MRNKENLSKVFYMAVWSVIFLLAAYILIKGGIVFGTEDRFKVVGEFRDYIISEISIYIEKENIELMQFTLDWQENKDASLMERYISYLSPFEGVVLNTDIEESENAVEVSNQLNQILLRQRVAGSVKPTGKIGFIFGESYYEDGEIQGGEAQETMAISATNQKLISQLTKYKEVDFLLKNFYIVDRTTSVDKSIFQVDKLLKKDFTIKKKSDKPQILIYHTHAMSEAFSDSRDGKQEDSVVGVGSRLAEILSNKYGYNVIHDQSQYDMVNGKIDRNKAYNAALDNVEQILKDNPTIEVIIDLHRDGVLGKEKKLTVINGKKTAQIMLFNGLSRNQKGPIDYLYNPKLQSNIAFSLQVKLASMEKYPNFATRNYLKNYRYNMQLLDRFLLVELGNQNNTVQEAKNAMDPLAEVINDVLTKD